MRKRFFQGEGELPEIVQKKADRAFSQIREEAMAAEAAKKERNHITSRRRFAIVAICFAVMVTAAVPNILGGGKTDYSFVLTAQAAELKPDAPYILRQGGSSMGINNELLDEKGSIKDSRDYGYYAVNVQLRCEGENIDTIFYDISRGAFQLAQRKGCEIVKKGKETMLLNCGQTGGGRGCTVKYYEHFTVDYENQGKPGDVWINIADEKVPLPEDVSSEDSNWEKYIYEAISDTYLTCIVQYKDGHTEEVRLQFDASEDEEGYMRVSVKRMH